MSAQFAFPGGQSLVGRLDRDILAEPGVGTVIIDEGLEDVLWEHGSAADEALLMDDYRIIQEQLNAFGIQVYLGTLTPCGGYSNTAINDVCDSSSEAARLGVNTTISDIGNVCVVPFSKQVAEAGTSSPVDLATADAQNDDVNLTLGTTGGYGALAQAVINTATDTLGPACGIEPVGPPAPETS